MLRSGVFLKSGEKSGPDPHFLPIFSPVKLGSGPDFSPDFKRLHYAMLAH
jgi:hypothetical protein